MSKKRKRKWIRWRRPGIYIGPRGVRAAPPSVRVGRKVGINIGRRGISGSVRTKFGSFNTRRGCTFNIFRLFGCSTFLLLLMGASYVVLRVAYKSVTTRNTQHALRG